MKFKHPHYANEFNEAPIILQIIANDFRARSLEFGIEPVITRITEKVDGDSGVHDTRALDFRDFHMNKHLYTRTQRIALVSFINGKYQRTDQYEVCSHHDAGSGDHFHLQVPYLTESLKGPLWR